MWTCGARGGDDRGRAFSIFEIMDCHTCEESVEVTVDNGCASRMIICENCLKAATDHSSPSFLLCLSLRWKISKTSTLTRPT